MYLTPIVREFRPVMTRLKSLGKGQVYVNLVCFICFVLILYVRSLLLNSLGWRSVLLQGL